MDPGTPQQLLQSLRNKHPLVHYLGNMVTMNFTANGLLALGARPVMALAPQEVAAIAGSADAVVLNAGTPTAERQQAWFRAAEASRKSAIPLLVDPVGIGASPWRRDLLQAVLERHPPDLVRGNPSEVAALLDQTAKQEGVDAPDSGTGYDGVHLARQAAQALGAIVAVTGATDYASDGERTVAIEQGTPWFKRLTGAGCLLSGVMAAYAAVADDLLEGAVAALVTYGLAGEKAKERSTGMGTFAVSFLDSLGEPDADSLQKASWRWVQDTCK